MVVIGEENAEGPIFAGQQNYGPHTRRSTAGCALWASTYTPEEIRRQIAQAEIDAHSVTIPMPRSRRRSGSAQASCCAG